MNDQFHQATHSQQSSQMTRPSVCSFTERTAKAGQMVAVTHVRLLVSTSQTYEAPLTKLSVSRPRAGEAPRSDDWKGCKGSFSARRTSGGPTGVTPRWKVLSSTECQSVSQVL